MLRLVWIACVALAACKSAEDSPHLKRAKELLSISEWDNARTELKLEIKRSPSDTARGLLLYATERPSSTEDLPHLLDLAVIVHSVAQPEWNKVSAETRDATSKILIKIRQALYDEGIDTKDSADLAKVLTVAASWALDHDDDQARKDVGAAVLAVLEDRPAAKTHLLERLKSQQPGAVADYIARVGAPMLPPLVKLANDPAFLGREAATEVLARIQARVAATKLAAEQPALRYPASVPGVELLGDNFIEVRELGADIRAHAAFARVEGGTVDGVLLVQGYVPSSKQIEARSYALRAGELHPLSSVRDGKPFVLGGGSALFALQASAPARVTLRRIRQTSITRQVNAGRVARPAVGMRVRLRGYNPIGTIVREDEGLWVVRVDEPIDGMTELPVGASSLIALRSETTTDATNELITGKIDGDKLVVETVEDVAPDVWADGMDTPD